MEAPCSLGTRAPSPALSAQREPSSLPDDQVHIWRVPLNHSSDLTAALLKVLSRDERERAARYHFDKDRNQFIQARAALRFILGEYLSADPSTLSFSFGPQGKPALTNGHSDLRFNLSRRDGLALIAITRGRDIGVDVELVQTGLSFFQVADVSFSSTEIAALRDLPESLQAKGFYNCWTRKEAYVKARGEGLSFPLKQFDVSLTPGDPAKLLAVRDTLSSGNKVDEVDRWTMEELSVGEEYVAALGVEGSELKLTCRDWNPAKSEIQRTLHAPAAFVQNMGVDHRRPHILVA
jgi:4'-phosphopantetheinyl transferase